MAPVGTAGESRRTLSQELLFALPSVLCTSVPAARPPRPVLRLPRFYSSSEQPAPPRNSLANPTGDPGASRTRVPRSIPPPEDSTKGSSGGVRMPRASPAPHPSGGSPSPALFACGFLPLGVCVGETLSPPEEAPSRKQEGAAGINVYFKASLVQAPHPEVGRREGEAGPDPLEGGRQAGSSQPSATHAHLRGPGSLSVRPGVTRSVRGHK